MDLSDYFVRLTEHYEQQWGCRAVARNWTRGPVHQLADGFRILEFAETESRRMWTYATCGMSQPAEGCCVELHMFCSEPAEDLVELLTVVAHYHYTGGRLGLGHVINFGRGWRPGATCEHGLVSLPYLDGPEVENAVVCGAAVKCYWLIPITRAEADFAKTEGLERLEQRFEHAELNYLDEKRMSVV